MSHLLPTHTSRDVSHVNTALLPIGSFEQHGAHLPLITDTVVAMTIARELAGAYDVQLLPPITISCSHEHKEFPGTISISASTLTAVVSDIAASLSGTGVPNLVLVNGHGGNAVLANVVREHSVGSHRMAVFPASDDWRKARDEAEMFSTHHEDMHGGELETSILLHAYPELVGERYTSEDWLADDRRLLDTLGMAAYTKTGIIGKPSLATAAKGKAALQSLVASFEEYVEAVEGRS